MGIQSVRPTKHGCQIIQIELTAKQSEKAEVDLLMGRIESFKAVMVLPAATTVITDPDAASEELNREGQKAESIRQLLHDIDHFPHEKLDPPEAAAVAESGESAKELLKKLSEKCDELQKQMELLTSLRAEQTRLEEKLTSITNQLNTLAERSSTPQPIESAEEGARKCDELAGTIVECQNELEQLQALRKQKDLPTIEIERLTNNLNATNAKLAEVALPLRVGVEKCREIAATKASLTTKLNELAKESGVAAEIGSAKEREQKLAPIRVEVDSLYGQLTQLSKMGDDPAIAVISPSEQLEMQPLKRGVEELQTRLAEEANRAARDMRTEELVAAFEGLTAKTPDAEILPLEDSLNELRPYNDPRLEALSKRMEELKAQKLELREKLDRMNKELGALSQRALSYNEQLEATLPEKSRDVTISELKKAVEELDGQVIPSLIRIETSVSADQRAEGLLADDPTKKLAEARLTVERLKVTIGIFPVQTQQ